jgi:hypothetical protein
MENTHVNRLDKRIAEAAETFIAATPVPPFDSKSIHRRSSEASTSRNDAQRSRFLRTLPVAAAVIAIAILFNIGAVFATVTQAMNRFFLVSNGKPVPVQARVVTLDQARHDMPFTVITPAAVPADLHATITELRTPSRPQDTHLLIEYRRTAGGVLPLLTIVEATPTTRGTGTFAIQFHERGGSPPPLPGLLREKPGPYLHGEFRTNGKQIGIRPVSFVTHGTRVDVISPPGALTSTQLNAIRSAMLQ